jgi:hypothetical protein
MSTDGGVNGGHVGGGTGGGENDNTNGGSNNNNNVSFSIRSVFWLYYSIHLSVKHVTR